ncbi:hypothetical protein V8C37DRAFT_413380 [Trichoderma ceciliae]
MDFSSLVATLEAGEIDPTLKIIDFTTVEELFDEINCATGDALAVKRTITITTSPHEQLHLSLYANEVYYQFCTMGLGRSWRNMGATTFYTGGPYSSSGGGGSGEGDSSGRPLAERNYRGAYPTLMVEAAYSNSMAYLRMKARWQRIIFLERWEERQQDPRHGATTTRRASQLVASCHQEISITKSNTNPPVYQVTSGDLLLSFRLLFLRDPQAGERDVVISVADLQKYAEAVWADMED